MDGNCFCETGYEGATCQHRVDNCNPNPCKHGSCTNTEDGFNCECDDGFEGTFYHNSLAIK